MDMLVNHDLVSEALEKLHQNSQWENPLKKRNLINAFSEIYDTLLTNGATFADLTGQKVSHLDLVAFNSTEFDHGLNFRFQAEWREDKQYRRVTRGNANIKLTFDQQNEVKLADVIAASSCFPGGFEPIGFPHDFIYKDEGPLYELKNSDKFPYAIGLMDGGIYDNQGIDSIQVSERRRANMNNDVEEEEKAHRKPYDLMIISDVSSPDIPMSSRFRFHQSEERNISHYSINHITHLWKNGTTMMKWLSWILLLGGLVMVLFSGFSNSIATGVGICLSGVGVVLIIIYRFLNGKVKKWAYDGKAFINGIVGDYYRDKLSNLNFKNYTVEEVEPLIIDRINSVVLMVKDIFLKQVRRLKYASVYKDNFYEYRRVANLIKELTPDNWERTKDYQETKGLDPDLVGNYEDIIGSPLGKVTETAASFGTTLWFTDEDKLKNTLTQLIVTGQATMCFNMMIYLAELRTAPDYQLYDAGIQEELSALYEQCKKDWKNFRVDPHFMV